MGVLFNFSLCKMETKERGEENVWQRVQLFVDNWRCFERTWKAAHKWYAMNRETCWVARDSGTLLYDWIYEIWLWRSRRLWMRPYVLQHVSLHLIPVPIVRWIGLPNCGLFDSRQFRFSFPEWKYYFQVILIENSDSSGIVKILIRRASFSRNVLARDQ